MSSASTAAASYQQQPYGSPMSGAGPYNQYGNVASPAAGVKGQPYQQQQQYQQQPQTTYNPMGGNTGMMGDNSFINPQYQQSQGIAGNKGHGLQGWQGQVQQQPQTMQQPPTESTAPIGGGTFL